MEERTAIQWKQCTEIIRDNVTPTVYNTWFAPLEVVSYDNNLLVLRVKSQFVAQYIEENYIDLLSKAILHVFGPDTRLEYRVLMDSTTGTVTTYRGEELQNTKAHTPVREAVTFNTHWDTYLNEAYTFSNFIKGETNKLARNAGVAIAKEPGKTIFNPLFIYGGSGVGKTHLANAIGNQIARSIPGCKVLYVSANTFKLQYQADDGTWVDADVVEGNQMNKVIRTLPQPITSNRVRLQMIQGEQDGYTTRIYEFAVYGYLKGDDPTGIGNVLSDEGQGSSDKGQGSSDKGRGTDNGWYDLQGHQVHSAETNFQRGIYIRKGKKYIKP